MTKLIRKSSAKIDKFSDVVVVALESTSPVSLGRQRSDMTWEKAKKLASKKNHLWW